MALKNQIDNYFDANRMVAVVNDKIFRSQQEKQQWEGHKATFEKLKDNISGLYTPYVGYEGYQNMFFQLEKSILEAVYAWIQSREYIYLKHFDIPKSFGKILQQPLSLQQGTWPQNYRNLLTLKSDVEKWVRQVKVAEQHVDWSTGHYIHYIFRTESIMKSLRDHKTTQIPIKLQHEYRPGDNVTIVRGVARNTVNARVNGVYVYLELDPPQYQHNPSKIYVKITHDGTSKFNKGEDMTDTTHWIEVVSGTLTEITKFENDDRGNTLSLGEQQQKAKLQIQSNSFDCSQIKPTGDLLGKKMCPGVFANYILSVPRSENFECPKLRTGTNCKDLDISRLKAIHFHAKIMYRPMPGIRKG